MEEITTELKCIPHKRKAWHLSTNIIRPLKLLGNDNKNDINVQQVKSLYLLCDKCVSKFQLRENLISLLDVGDFKDNSLIDNWPQGLDDKHFDFIKDSASINHQNFLLDQLNKFQENMINDIREMIKSVFIKQFKTLKEKVPQNTLLSQYNSLFQTDKLIEIVNQFEDSKYESFLSEFELTRSAKIQQLNEYIESIKQYENLIQFKQLEATKKVILDIILEMKFFNDNNEDKNNDKVECQQNQQQKKQQKEYLEKIQKELSINSKYEENTAHDILKLLEKKREMVEIGFNKSRTKYYCDQYLQDFSEQYDIEEIKSLFKAFPIFDLCTIQLQQLERINSQINQDDNERKDILDSIQLVQQQFGFNKEQIVISPYSQGKIQMRIKYIYDFRSCISNMVLKPNIKYLFRVLIEGNLDDSEIGFRYKSKYQAMSTIFLFQKIKQKIGLIPILDAPIFEIRVWLEGEQADILQYPEMNLVQSIEKSVIKDMEDLTLQFSLRHLTKVSLLQAYQVEEF